MNPSEGGHGVLQNPARVLNIVLVEPQIPENTGNISRTCAVTGARLHLVHPLGFEITAARVKRAGLDYWDKLDITQYPGGLDDFFAKTAGPYHFFSTKAARFYTDIAYADGAHLVFGREDAGLPEALLRANGENCVRLPQRDGLRSLNLSNAVAVATYEALRQWAFSGLG